MAEDVSSSLRLERLQQQAADARVSSRGAHGGEDDDDEVLAIRDALGMVADDENLRSALLPVGDGLLVAVKV